MVARIGYAGLPITNSCEHAAAREQQHTMNAGRLMAVPTKLQDKLQTAIFC
jgi:hypothetical protein